MLSFFQQTNYMNKTVLIIGIFLIIFLWKLFTIRKLEHLTAESDEAIQNLASLYNKDNLTIGNLIVTNNATVSGTLSGPTISNILNKSTSLENKLTLLESRIAALEGRTMTIESNTSNISNVVYKGSPIKIKSNQLPSSGSYGPYLSTNPGDYDRAVYWRDPKVAANPPVSYTFNIE